MSNNKRTSLVPAPAVIPALVVYTKVVAVKKLVVEFKAGLGAKKIGNWIGTGKPGKVQFLNWSQAVLKINQWKCESKEIDEELKIGSGLLPLNGRLEQLDQ
eukprot:TRINITY_DN4109_c0_g1_i1.p1 TRINITY_DN4109_c0_g1~~TRINITY_DN4109_c0_g1_i1.p1  ORF type:complete len:101 (+),score=3.89 TRINITY_DN4109_c0_g1_i1:523-825(+)